VIEEVVPGGTLDPGALLSGLARAVIERGGRITELRSVRGIEPGTPVTLKLSRGRVTADQVVLALNAFTPTLLPQIDELRAALTLALCTEPLDPVTLRAIGLGEGTPFYTADLPYLWGRPLPDGRVIFGSGLAFDAGEDLGRIDIHEGDAAQTLSHLEARVRRLHPLLEDVRISTRWGGPVAFFRDRRPLLGALPGTSNVFITGGYAGHGIALGIRMGELVADVITGRGALPPWAGIRSADDDG
jgi:gamma-glutamylputrescine oxidase